MDIAINIRKDVNNDELEKMWLQLESIAKPAFFLTWQWIGSWIASVKPSFFVIEAWNDSKLVGLGILVEKKEFRHGFVFTKQLYLNKSGFQEKDQMWIEYNDFLLDPEFEIAARVELFNTINNLKYDELIIGPSTSTVHEACRSVIQNHKVSWSTQSYQVLKNMLSDEEQGYLKSLSRNTRQQIKRSLKVYSEFGSANISAPDSLKQRSEWFGEMSRLHKERWQVSSGFYNDYFVKFHRRILFEQKGQDADLYKITFGSKLIGYFYCFMEEETVRFYMSALDRETKGNNYRPGLVGHYLLINYFFEHGYNRYDFMGGSSRYKSSMSNNSFQLSQLTYQQPKLRFVIERTLSNIRKSLTNN